MRETCIDPSSIKHILITHQDTDHVGAIERDIDGLFRNATVYLIDNEYPFTGDTIWFGADGGYSFINSLAEDNELSMKSLERLERLLRERNLHPKVITGHTGWTDDLDFVFAHRDKVCNSMKKQKPHDPNAPYDGYDEKDDTEERARGKRLAKVIPVTDNIKSAYHSSKDIYDDVLTQGNIWSRMYMSFFWEGTDDREVAKSILSYIPDDFRGKILDVPVGTAVFTEEKWRSLKNAGIMCLDYSEDMLEKAKARLGNCEHISFVQGDVGQLPLADGSCDIVLSMNGFHAFPDKNKAFRETYRVLKPGGQFIACFYIKGKNKRTDWLVHRILSKKGWFTPPFPTEEQLLKILDRLYLQTDYNVDGSIAYFRCIKGE